MNGTMRRRTGLPGCMRGNISQPSLSDALTDALPRLKPEMWSNLATELQVPWRAAEAMHWQLGEAGMASRAGVTPFSLTSTQAQPRQSSLHVPMASPPSVHHHEHPDQGFEGMHHQQHPGQSYSGLRLPHPPLLPNPTAEREEIMRHTRPPSPLINLSPEQQSRRVLPSMAELDQGLTIAAMEDAQKNTSFSRSQ